MKVFAISDLHLPADDNKPMDVFGSHWEKHFERISEDWRARVSDEDIVLLPGDFTWAMRLEQAIPDLNRVGELPGRKVLIRGNHDYWWSSVSRVREKLPKGMYAVQNDAVNIDGYTFCGTRGWLLACECKDEDDKRINERELKRLKLSIDTAKRISAGRRIICLLHYPPLTDANRNTEFSRMLENEGMATVVYGHLHGAALHGAFIGENNGVDYHLASCDGTDFRLIEIE